MVPASCLHRATVAIISHSQGSLAPAPTCLSACSRQSDRAAAAEPHQGRGRPARAARGHLGGALRHALSCAVIAAAGLLPSVRTSSRVGHAGAHWRMGHAGTRSAAAPVPTHTPAARPTCRRSFLSSFPSSSARTPSTLATWGGATSTRWDSRGTPRGICKPCSPRSRCGGGTRDLAWGLCARGMVSDRYCARGVAPCFLALLQSGEIDALVLDRRGAAGAVAGLPPPLAAVHCTARAACLLTPVAPWRSWAHPALPATLQLCA